MSIFKDKTLLITGGTGSFGTLYFGVFWIPILRRSVSLAVMRKSRMICVISCRILK